MSEKTQKSDEPDITAELVITLVAEQFPRWAHLPIEPVKPSGWDNRTFHLGKDMSVRLPSAERYAAQVHTEQKWLPALAPHLSCPVPEPLAMGSPSQYYPWHWSVYRWIDGENADTLSAHDRKQFAADSAKFLTELRRIDTAGGPLAGARNFYRGAALSIYDDETRTAISRLEGTVDTDAATKLWENAVSTKWPHRPVWIHGDFSAGNLLVRGGRLTAVIDFGTLGVGDPACDLVIAWTFLDEASRKIFRTHMDPDPDTWDRARGWCLWKALITLESIEDKNNRNAAKQKRIIDDVLSDLW